MKLNSWHGYHFKQICACTKVGCGSDQSCAVIKGMTDKKGKEQAMLLAQEANRDLTGICIFIAILNSVNKNWYYF